MRTLHLIMPMAGKGNRFKEAGYLTPKPLIQVEKTPLFFRACQSMSRVNTDIQYSFIVRKEHIVNNNIDDEIKKLIPKANIISIDRDTDGAVETCLKAKDYICPDQGILVMDCDLEFRSAAFESQIENILSQPASASDGGALLSFESQDSRYSYAAITNENKVIKTAEKQVISQNALVGAYFFGSGTYFLDAAEKLINDRNYNNYHELYTSLLMNYVIAKGKTVKLTRVGNYRSFGTPDELIKNASDYTM